MLRQGLDIEIDDPDDKKPIDWVEEAKIPDPAATKPEDWDEDAPLEIPDEDAKVSALPAETCRVDMLLTWMNSTC